jgi:hypothetical protein
MSRVLGHLELVEESNSAAQEEILRLPMAAQNNTCDVSTEFVTVPGFNLCCVMT